MPELCRFLGIEDALPRLAQRLNRRIGLEGDDIHRRPVADVELIARRRGLAEQASM